MRLVPNVSVRTCTSPNTKWHIAMAEHVAMPMVSSVTMSGRTWRNTSTMSSTTAARSKPPKIATSVCAFEAAAAACSSTPEPAVSTSGATSRAAPRARAMAFITSWCVSVRYGSPAVAARTIVQARCEPSVTAASRTTRMSPSSRARPVPGSSSAKAADASPSGSSEMPNGRVKPSGVYAARSALRSSVATSPRASSSRSREASRPVRSSRSSRAALI
jgi:hypothetical protein